MGNSVESWLKMGFWVTGTIIYGWLFTGLLNKRDYPNLTFSSALGLLDLGPALLGGLTVMGLAWLFRRKNTVNSGSNRLFRIVVAVLPALFVVSALATLVLTLTTYNGDWVDARQGLATAFAALIAAVGVVVSVAVSYQTGEENRLAQQENLRRQLEHQREIEDERAQREQNKQDAEIIKSLNDRMHEILSRRYSKDENERSASYFQLATLYQDWETLAASSEVVKRQKNSQQRNILKILFGVPQEKDGELVDGRTKLEETTLNSIIQDIFPVYQKSAIPINNKFAENYSESRIFDLSFLDLRNLNFSYRDLGNSNLNCSHLEDSYLWGAYLKDANLGGVFLKDSTLNEANMNGCNLRGANLEGAKFWHTNLKDAELYFAHLERAYLAGVNLEKADLFSSFLNEARFIFREEAEDINNPETRKFIVERVSCCEMLPAREELLKSDLSEGLVDEIITEHRRRRAAQGNAALES
ncbi:pentapeptide repeat-containing protein [Rothia sp. CCM 9417]|uniref:pentapeptide repeat-containing protein n=1 Tax=Rothia sp. CCM 9417 TaxID=3402657 RepID=UPI003AE65D11